MAWANQAIAVLRRLRIKPPPSAAAERALTFEPEHQVITVAGRKTVTVYADTAASASAQAGKQNPGGTVERVKKVNNDPKSRAYQVTLTK